MSSPDGTSTPQRSLRTKYPWWAAPFSALLGAGCVVASLGGPDALLNWRVGVNTLVVTAASIALGIALTVVLTWWRDYRRRGYGAGRRVTTTRGRTNWGLLGAIVLAVLALRTLTEAVPVVGTVIFGVLAGTSLASSVLFLWEARYPPPAK
ncbi:MAG TPA: hypothetical protein VN906_00950 [Candidatus Sulfotelmatobacter sp.]|nr:hypothetical protein [Candidatus Sulfotelmatobacter sp.]